MVIFLKVPKGKWFCQNCCLKHPRKRQYRRHNSRTNLPPSLSTEVDNSCLNTTTASTSPHIDSSTNGILSPTPCSVPTEPQPPTKSPPPPPSSSSSSSPVQTISMSNSHKRLKRGLGVCRKILDELEAHSDSWPFLLPVNTKQFPTYKKVIKIPMDLSMIRSKLKDGLYRTTEEFSGDVRQMFSNCETFNEDDSPVGNAGHKLNEFFDSRWHELVIDTGGTAVKKV